MSSDEFPIPETNVLAIASHVVYGYVGNTMATFVMQSLGCEVSALNTVNYSNHLGYGQTRGTKVPADEITDLYTGLKECHLSSFDMLLSGYLPGAAAIEAAGSIARDLKYKHTMKPGSFFWILDPVMGDNGKLYVDEDCVDAYKAVIRDADLILPNQFEAETLSGVKIGDMDTLKQAVAVLHQEYRVPHVLVTSVALQAPGAEPHLQVIGSTCTSTYEPRIFTIKVPAIDCFFSGTGDMFAALILVRLREAVFNTEGLSSIGAWLSADDIDAQELPLANAAEKVLASMHEILNRTKIRRDEEWSQYRKHAEKGDDEKRDRQARSKAAEVRLVRNVGLLKNPEVRFSAEKL